MTAKMTFPPAAEMVMSAPEKAVTLSDAEVATQKRWKVLETSRLR